jgi:predicted transcriptional regulator
MLNPTEFCIFCMLREQGESTVQAIAAAYHQSEDSIRLACKNLVATTTVIKADGDTYKYVY